MIRTSFIKHTGLLFSGSFIAQAIGFFITMILSRLYAPEDFGALGLFTGMVSVLMVVSGFRYEMAIVVEDDRSKALHLTQLSMLLNLAFGILLFGIALLFRSQIASWFNVEAENWLLLAPLVVTLSGMMESLVFWKNREKQYSKISGNRILTASTAAAAKWSFFSLSDNGLILGHSLAQLIGLIHLWVRSGVALFRVDLLALRHVAKSYKQFPFYSMPAALVNILAVKMPVFVLILYAGEEATGHLDNASRLTYLPMSMLAMASSQVFFERIARAKQDKEHTAELSRQLIRFLFALGIVPAALLVVFGEQLIPWVLGKGDTWLEAGQYVQILILFYFTLFLTVPFSSAFETYDKLKVQLIYNSTFLVCTTAALLLGFHFFDSVHYALGLYAIVGGILRLGVLNYFFLLFGKPLFSRTLLGIAIAGGLIWLLQQVKTVLEIGL